MDLVAGQHNGLIYDTESVGNTDEEGNSLKFFRWNRFISNLNFKFQGLIFEAGKMPAGDSARNCLAIYASPDKDDLD